MNTTELKALADRLSAMANREANETEDDLNAGAAAILSLIAALESAQERVKALEEGLNGVLLCGRGTSGRIILEGWQEEAARALLEKTT